MIRNLNMKFINFSIKNVIPSVSSYSIMRHASSVPVPVPVRYRDTQIKSTFLMKATGMPKQTALSTVLTNQEFRLTSVDLMKQSLDVLKNAGYESSIQKYPELLLVDCSILKNRILFLEDCCFNREKIPYLLTVFDSLPYKKISTLKNFDFLAPSVNIVEVFLHLCKLPTTENRLKYDDWDTFRDVYCKFYKFYVQRELGLSDEEVEKVMKPLKWISFRYLRYNVKIIREVFLSSSHDLKFLKYLLHANPESFLCLFKTVKNQNLIHVIKKNPKALSATAEVIEKNSKFLQENNINEVAPTYVSLLTMNSDLNFNRLNKVLDTYELQAFVKHPRFMHLINRSYVAHERLDMLKKLNMKCFTINQLTCPDENFIRHIANGIDKVRCNDKFHLLSTELGRTRLEIRQRLHLNPYAGYIPLHNVIETLNYLKQLGFSAEDIFISLPIVLYRRGVIQDAVENSVPNLLKSMNYSIDPNITTMKQYLPLVLYCIEKQHNFTGNGVWIAEKESVRPNFYIE